MTPIRLYTFEKSEGEDGGGVSAWTPPEDWPAQFKTPEDLLKSYQGLRPEMDRTKAELEAERAEKAQLAELLSTMETQRPEPQQRSGFNPEVAAWTDAIERGDYAAAMEIQSEVNQRRTVNEMRKMLDERDQKLQPVLSQQQAAQREASIRMAEDMAAREIGAENYQALLPKMSEIIAANQHFLPEAASVEGYRDAILNVAKLADHDRLAQFEQDEARSRAEKLAAQTISSSSRVANVATGDAAKEEFERIKNTPVGSYSELMSR